MSSKWLLGTAIKDTFVKVLDLVPREKRDRYFPPDESGAMLRRAGLLAAAFILLLCVYSVQRIQRNDGVRVTYFKGTNFEERVCTRTESEIYRSYGTGSPVRGVPSNNWSARWEGVLEVPIEAEYDFYSQSDDGVRLFIDDHMVIDNWREQNWKASGRHGKTILTQGPHRLIVEFFNSSGCAYLKIMWRGGVIERGTLVAVPFLKKGAIKHQP